MVDLGPGVQFRREHVGVSLPTRRNRHRRDADDPSISLVLSSGQESVGTR